MTTWAVLLLAILLPVRVYAGNDMENSYHWMITPGGVNTVNIQIPVYDCAGLDGFVDNGYLYITPDGEASPAAVTAKDELVSFLGIFSPLSVTQEDKSLLYLGAANKLYYPNAAMTIGSFRAYFQLNGISGVKSCNLNFGDSETGIEEIVDSKSLKSVSPGTWFSLDGRQLSGKPAKSGLYINNGRKIVVK